MLMPLNKDIKLHCEKKDCYWICGEFGENCANPIVSITDDRCFGYINKDEAKKRLNNVAL
jgi:hypothetical protein